MVCDSAFTSCLRNSQKFWVPKTQLGVIFKISLPGPHSPAILIMSWMGSRNLYVQQTLLGPEAQKPNLKRQAVAMFLRKA